ncbi:MAG TPA: NepR family anti-sigma factor [Pseudorhodoplanes sp.]|nr:NepR family anti-sigma factor [Pseudorhodoplanes sp.]
MNSKKMPPRSDMKADTAEQQRSGLNREIQAKIGQQLRAMYDDVVQEGVPERFANLLKRLDKPADEGKS